MGGAACFTARIREMCFRGALFLRMDYFEGLVQDSGNSSVLAMDLVQS